MTANQINYAKLKEETRHNLASEGLARVGNDLAFAKAYADQRNAETNAKNAETNLLNASLRRMELYETARANQAREAQSVAQLAETQRSNQVAETLRNSELQEKARSNVVNEQLSYSAQSEAARHNVESERREQVKTRAGIVQTLVSTVGNLIGRFA
jgi:hypothetical protein